MAPHIETIAMISLAMGLPLESILEYSNRHLAFQFESQESNVVDSLEVPNSSLLAQQSDIWDVSHIEAAVCKAMPKTSYLRLRTADSSAATAFAMCFSVCAAVTTSLHYSGTLSSHAIWQCHIRNMIVLSRPCLIQCACA